MSGHEFRSLCSVLLQNGICRSWLDAEAYVCRAIREYGPHNASEAVLIEIALATC